MTYEYSIKSTHHKKTIQFDYRKAKDSQRPLILFVHGFKGFKDWGHFNLIATKFQDHGFNVIKLNFSHNGTSKEHPTDFVDLESFGMNNFSIELNDLNDLIHHLHTNENFKNYIDLSGIHIIGHSRGGSTALLKASNDKKIKSVITWGSPLNILNRYGTENKRWKDKGVEYVYNGRTKQNMPLYYQSVEDILLNKERYDLYKILKNTKTKTLIIHSKEDTTVPYQETELIKDNPNVTISLIEKGSHTFDGHHPFTGDLPAVSLKVIKLSIDFISNYT